MTVHHESSQKETNNTYLRTVKAATHTGELVGN